MDCGKVRIHASVLGVSRQAASCGQETGGSSGINRPVAAGSPLSVGTPYAGLSFAGHIIHLSPGKVQTEDHRTLETM